MAEIVRDAVQDRLHLVVPDQGRDDGGARRLGCGDVVGPLGAGADVLVIGRPITATQDPGLAARDIAKILGISAS